MLERKLWQISVCYVTMAIYPASPSYLIQLEDLRCQAHCVTLSWNCYSQLASQKQSIWCRTPGSAVGTWHIRGSVSLSQSSMIYPGCAKANPFHRWCPLLMTSRTLKINCLVAIMTACARCIGSEYCRTITSLPWLICWLLPFNYTMISDYDILARCAVAYQFLQLRPMQV